VSNGHQAISELYWSLTATRFSFLHRGAQPLSAIYAAVRREYATLCDDSYLCKVNCPKAGSKAPEWNHAVRRALTNLSGRFPYQVARGPKKGTWVFGSDATTYADEVQEADNEGIFEGRVRRVFVNAYERKPKAREDCIALYGSTCSICGMDFGQAYGDSMRGYIHIHHLVPLSEIGKEYMVDAATQLRPVCPNCHAFLHSSTPVLTIEKAKAIFADNKRRSAC
jgi:hypothetical protein